MRPIDLRLPGEVPSESTDRLDLPIASVARRAESFTAVSSDYDKYSFGACSAGALGVLCFGLFVSGNRSAL